MRQLHINMILRKEVPEELIGAVLNNDEEELTKWASVCVEDLLNGESKEEFDAEILGISIRNIPG